MNGLLSKIANVTIIIKQRSKEPSLVVLITLDYTSEYAT